MRKMAVYIIALTVSVMAPRLVFGDELAEIKAQMQKIAEENRALREHLDRQEEVTKRLLEKVEALESKDKILAAAVEILKETPHGILEEEAVVPRIIDVPRLEWKGFTDIGFISRTTRSESSNTFNVGAIDLFITSKISDSLNFLTEMEFHPDPDDNDTHFHLERVNLKYSFSDLLNIKIGRIHTALGYWNQTFHHGRWLQTTVFRPEIYTWEDDKGGFLPAHSIGIDFFGIKVFDAFDLNYNFGVFNGRGRTRTEIQNFKDKNDSKAVNFLIGLKPYAIEGLKFGANVYYDTIPSNPSVAARTARIEELILGGYATYVYENLELLGELFNIHHDDKASGNDFNTLGFYLQGGYKIDDWTPYYRFDFIDFGQGDPYFTNVDVDIKKHILGVRWDIVSWNALKFEYSFNEKRDSDDEHSFVVNSSFTF